MTTYEILCHHGILGMKWGVRRYQNEDETLTPAGRERYGRGGGERSSRPSASSSGSKEGDVGGLVSNVRNKVKRRKEMTKEFRRVYAKTINESKELNDLSRRVMELYEEEKWNEGYELEQELDALQERLLEEVENKVRQKYPEFRR